MKAVLLMTCACAIAILADCFIAAILGLVLVRAIVIGVTTGTVGLERSVLPDDDLRVVLMTVATSQIAAVIQRLERRTCVTEIIRYEGVRVVAEITFQRGDKVSRILADCGRPVMAGRTGAQNLCVIDIQHRRPGRRRVAVFADVGSQHVLRILAGRDTAVMTADAVVCHVGMIVSRR